MYIYIYIYIWNCIACHRDENMSQAPREDRPRGRLAAGTAPFLYFIHCCYYYYYGLFAILYACALSCAGCYVMVCVCCFITLCACLLLFYICCSQVAQLLFCIVKVCSIYASCVYIICYDILLVCLYVLFDCCIYA